MGSKGEDKKTYRFDKEKKKKATHALDRQA
jgi:hypothetical protein